VTVDIEDVVFGLPEVPGVDITPRPADTMPAPGLMDPTIVNRSFVF
jgi:hypothetical protein